MQQARKWPELNLKSPGIKARSGRLPAPLHVVTSSVRLHDSPADAFPHELPETPPHGSQITVPHIDHSVFAPVLFGMSYLVHLNYVLTIIIDIQFLLFFQQLYHLQHHLVHLACRQFRLLHRVTVLNLLDISLLRIIKVITSSLIPAL